MTMKRFFIYFTALAPLLAQRAATKTLWDVYKEGMTVPDRGHSLNIESDFGAVGDGKTLNTAAIRATLDAAAAWNEKNSNAGVEITIPRGIFLTAPINLTSHITITVVEGGTLLATDDPLLWPVVAPLPSYGTGRDHIGPRRCPFVGGFNLSDIVIQGPGTIDGAGENWWKRHILGQEKVTRGRLIEFEYSDGILFDGIKLQNSPFWTVHPTYCSNVVARNLHIENPHDSPNTDGFDPDSTVNVSLVDSYFSVGDDGVAIKSGWDCFGIDTNIPSKNIHIRNLTVNSPCCAGICIGSEMSGGVSNVLVEDSNMMQAGQGLRIKSGEGRGGYVENITYRNVNIGNALKWAIQINDYYGSRNQACGDRNATAMPHLRNIRFENIAASGIGNGLNAYGLPGSGISDLVLRNVTLNVSGSKIYDCSHVGGTFNADVRPRPTCDKLVPSSSSADK